jgi:hypothetical protein
LFHALYYLPHILYSVRTRKPDRQTDIRIDRHTDRQIQGKGENIKTKACSDVCVEFIRRKDIQCREEVLILQYLVNNECSLVVLIYV